MSIWRIWGETGRIIAILCLTTALAAVTAAVILLVHEDLTERLSDRVKRGIGRKTGILALVAAGVWILVIGQSVAAAEVPAENSGTAAQGNNGTAVSECSTSGTGSTSNEIAPEVEPGTEPDPGIVPEPEPDEEPPLISICMKEEIAEQEDGLIYCREDNAGIRISLMDDRENDTGIVSYCIILADSAGKEIRIDNTPDSAVRQETVIEIGAEKTAKLSDGLIRVTAEAADEEGNRGECEFSFVLDTVSPVLEADFSTPIGNPAGIDERSGIVYFGSDPRQYAGGVPVITASFLVTDQNIDPSRLEARCAYAAVPEGQCCEQVRPAWESASKEECRAEVVESVEGEPGSVLLQLERVPGSAGTPDGVYRFGITGRDKAGNPLVLKNGESGMICEDTEKGTFVTGRMAVDTKAPEGELLIENEDGGTYCRMTGRGKAWTMDRDSFRPYINEENAVIVYSAVDISPASMTCRFLSTAGEENDMPPDGGDFYSACEGRIRVRGGQIFRIEELRLRDRAGNEAAVLRRTPDFYLDTAAPEADLEAPSAVVRAVPQITAKMADGRPLYDGPVTLEVFAEDPDREHGGSGLAEVRCEVTRDGETVMEKVLFRGERAEWDENAEPAGEAEQNLTYRFHGEISVPSGGEWDSNDYEVTVIAADNAGNLSDPADGGIRRFGIDTAGPEVKVSFDNNEMKNGRYFDKTRTASVAVRERNFDAGKLQVSALGAASGEWKKDPSGDPEMWMMELRFPIDGVYTLEVSGTDALGNAASVNYIGEAPQAFTIDRIPPLIEVLWDNTDVRNGRYYNAARRATVRVTDLSFDDNYVKILPFARTFRKVSEVRDDRMAGEIPVYEAEIPFTEEGEWALGCLCMDLAGNSAAPLFEDAFIIDWTAPKLYFDRSTVQEMGAYGAGISPALCCEEANITPGSLCARWNNLTANGGTMECRGGGSMSRVVLPDLPGERAADGICMLTGTACDLAGNRAEVRRNLCVNRFGSLYDLSEDEKTREMISAVYTEAENPLVIAEYNISPLTKRQITLFRNGNGEVLEEGKDYSVEEKRGAAGMKYVYRIAPAAFSREGKYSILLESEDETGNYNSSAGRFTAGIGSGSGAFTAGADSGSGGFTAGADSSPSWAVDRTPPAVRITGVDTQQSKFIADSVPLRLVPSDNMELSCLEIEITNDQGLVLESHTFRGEELQRIMGDNGGEVPLEISARGEWQTLRAAATDGAGNRSRGTGYRVLVSSNLMVHLYRSGVLPAAAFLGLILAIWFMYGVYKRTLA